MNTKIMLLLAFCAGAGGSFVITKNYYEEKTNAEVLELQNWFQETLEEERQKLFDNAVLSVDDEAVADDESYLATQAEIENELVELTIEDGPVVTVYEPTEEEVAENTEIIQLGGYSQEVEAQKAEYMSKASRRATEEVIQLISKEEYESGSSQYEKLNFTWYLESEILADENLDIIDDIFYHLGTPNPEHLLDGEEDVYIRNNDSGYEYHLDVSYSEYPQHLFHEEVEEG